MLVLDEATSNLDPGTEHAVEHALEALTEHRTVLVVAHRLSTAARADRVAVVDDGRIVELGPHDELVRREGRLREPLGELVVLPGQGLLTAGEGSDVDADVDSTCRKARTSNVGPDTGRGAKSGASPALSRNCDPPTIRVGGEPGRLFGR